MGSYLDFLSHLPRENLISLITFCLFYAIIVIRDQLIYRRVTDGPVFFRVAQETNFLE